MTEQGEARVTQPAHQQTQQEWQQVTSRAGITYLVSGHPDAPPLLFLHGIGGDGRCFARQLAQFRRDFRAVAWNMPGHNGSVPLPLVTMDALAAALAAFIGELGLVRPVLVGHSMGGMIALRLLAEAPHLARALVLTQTSAAFGGKDPAWAERFVAERLGPLDAGQTMASLAPCTVTAMAGRNADPEGIALAQHCMAQVPDSTYRDTVLVLRGFDQRSALGGIAVPALLIAGSEDHAAPADAMARMAARIPGAVFTVLEGAGHLAHLEQPLRFNEVLDGFLRGLPA